MSHYRFKLYHYPLTRSARVKWLLHELLGDDFELEQVALLKGAQYSTEFLQRNPNHAVPVLEIINPQGRVFTMIESGAMISFLADAFPHRALAPAPGLSTERADYLQMLHFGTSSMDMMLWQMRLHRDLLPADQRHQATLDRYMQTFSSEVEPQLIERLESGLHICGDQFSAVDCVMGQNINWAKAYGLCDDAAFTRYLATLETRSAFRAAFADRALFGE
jgi:glutathione S-transferase